MKLFAGFADGKTAVNFQHRNGAAIANVDFQRGVVGHFANSPEAGKMAMS